MRGEIIIYRFVLSAAIVPDGDAVWLPAEATCELGCLDVLVQKSQYRVALALS